MLLNQKIPNKPVFIIAEAGVNHNGDISIARRLIDAAKESGADAVKFQTFKAEEVVCRNAEKAQYQIENTGCSESQYDMIKALELSDEDFIKLKKYADDTGIMFLSTPFDHVSADFLEGLGMTLFKIPSGEITNIPLMEHIARKQKPIILSTGMSTLGEVEEAVNTLEGNGAADITLLHCTTSYPAPVESVNLYAMETMCNAFKLPVGYSDHTEGITIPIAATALGATVIEKHFTLDKKMPGPDHRSSLEPDELKAMVTAIRDVESAMGDGIKRPSDAEKENINIARKSIVARTNIKKGEKFSNENITLKRPGAGIKSLYIDSFIGKSANEDIKKDEQLKWSHIKE